METMSLSLDGMDELIENLGKAMAYYPDECRKTLKRTSYRFKGHAKKLASQEVKSDNNLTKGFWVSNVKSIGMDMESDFSAEGKPNPHWHLIEYGHDIIMPFRRNGKTRADAGEKKGFVPGKKVMPKIRESFQSTFIETLEGMTDRILREAGLV